MEDNVIRRKWEQGKGVRVDNLSHISFTGEYAAHTFEIYAVDVDGQEKTLNGTITAKFWNKNTNVTVPLDGVIVNGAASVTLHTSCYADPGFFLLTIYYTSDETRTVIYAGVGSVVTDQSDTIAYPTAAIPDITDLIQEVQDVIDSIPQEYSVLSQSVSDLKSAFDRTSGQPTYTWTLGKVISSSGSISDGSNGALSDIIPVHAGDIFIRKSPGYDGDGVNLSMQLAYYIGETFDSRVSVAIGTSKTIPTNITGVQVAFLHPSASGVAMTQSVIDGYFDAILARKAVLDVDYNSDMEDIDVRMDALDRGIVFFDAEFVAGNIYSDGTIVDNTKRAVTNTYLKLSYATTVWCDSAYRAILCTYTDQYAKIDRTVNTGGTILNIPANTYFKVCVYKNPEETITDLGVYAKAVGYIGQTQKQINTLEANAEFDFLRCFHTFCGIGDSLMAGYTKIGSATENSESGVASGNNWFDYLMTRLNRDGTNLAIGSSTTHNWRYGSQTGYPSTNLSGADIDGVDCYFVGLGVNDMIHPLENTIGTSADINSSDYTLNADSTYGNLDFILHKLAEFNPYAKVFVFTIPWRGDADPTDVNAAIRYVCSQNDNAFCIDLTVDNPVANNTFITSNFTEQHFNPMVYNLFSVIIENRINQYIYDNYTSFVWIPYKH